MVKGLENISNQINENPWSKTASFNFLKQIQGKWALAEVDNFKHPRKWNTQEEDCSDENPRLKAYENWFRIVLRKWTLTKQRKEHHIVQEKTL